MIKSLENLGKYGKHFTAKDWKDVEDFIDSNKECLDGHFKTLKDVFKDYQKEVKENDFLDDAEIRFLYTARNILEYLLEDIEKDVDEDVLADIEQKLREELENLDVIEQLQKELKRHQKREMQIFENGIKEAYDFFEHCLEELLENKLNQHINE